MGSGFIIGVTIWHFFLQSPALMKIQGKEKFVPLMMELTKLWSKVMFVTSSVVLLFNLALSLSMDLDRNLLFLIVGWLAIFINNYWVVPKAIKAGARSRKERKGDNGKDLQDFAVNGGGKVETKALHQTVVIFVVIMLIGFVGHLASLNTAMIAGC